MNKEALKTVGGTYLRAFVAGCGTAYLLGRTQPLDMLKAGIAGVIPVIMRWANPKDSFPHKS